MIRKVFISYRVADTRPVARSLAADLRRAFGDEAVFLDYRSLDPGGQWPDGLRTAAEGAAVVLVLIGRTWLTVQDEFGRQRISRPDDWVRQEVAAGLGGSGVVLPVLVNGADPIPPAAIEELPDIAALATAQALPLRDLEWDTDLKTLVDWLEAKGFERAAKPDVSTEGAPPAAAPAWRGNPYRGLSAFRSEDAPIYFGRERDTEALVRRLGEPDGRVVAVIGRSGSGKSSLVAAGLLPQLAAGNLPGSEDWLCVRFTPAEAGDDPFRALARRLAPHLHNSRSLAELTDHLRSSPTDIDVLAIAALEGRPTWAELLLLADQFEELFTRVAETHRAAFIALVAAVATSSRTRMVLTVRSDYYTHCTHYDRLTDLLRVGSFPLGAPGVTALQAMVEGPARAAGLAIEPEVVDRILDDAGTEPGALALVEFTLERLYDARAGDTLSLAAYKALGGVEGAIEDQGERAAPEVDGRVNEAALGNVFRALAAVDEAGGAVRKRAALEVLATDERAIVDRLVGARLLVTDTDTEGVATVEVAHEAVLRHWGRFRRWLDDNRALELWRQRLSVYRGSGQLLPPGTPLATALGWLRERAADLSKAERSYIARSRASARRAQGFRVSLAVLVVVIVIGGVQLAEWASRRGVPVTAWGGIVLMRLGLMGTPPEPEMVEVSPGTFTMGSPETEEGRSSDEGPQREVTLARPFSLGKHEVTFEQYAAYVSAVGGTQPSDENWGRASRPVINVSWNDARAYARWMALATGKSYRLPTEAEWEYAARAGAQTPYWWGNDIRGDEEVMANCDGCGSEFDGRSTAPVGSFKVNPFGLHDMHGNVWEWVQDCWHDNYEEAPVDGSAWLKDNGGDCARRVVRGGGWGLNPAWVRSALRSRTAADYRNGNLGFRLAQDP